jgi:succinate-semialdehyde dehydrogenase/glutarate-semialdehyde dehydrogenase
MAFKSVNPFDGNTVAQFQAFDEDRLEQALDECARATGPWMATDIGERANLMRAVAGLMRSRSGELAGMITREVGKLIGESRAEIEKCAWVCEYYAEEASAFLADESIESDAGRSLVAWQPLGTVLAIMPWNFPLWQVFRFAVPALMAGNTGLLKHASNVPQCALAIEELFRDAGFPRGVFTTLMIPAVHVAGVIEDRRVHAVTLTGSEPAGRHVAAVAGAQLKKSVLELGGSDAFIVLEDADLDLAVENAVVSRFLNCGQSCIAAKRFIVVDEVAEDFVERYAAAAESLVTGNPADEGTTLGPMARHDLRDELHQQVLDGIGKGARVVTGCAPDAGAGAFYQASVLDHVQPDMRAYHEELFGPVAVIIRARDATDALRIANDSVYGLGGSVWCGDPVRGESVARQLQCGCAFVNGMVKSDPRLPFGGIKHSGYGRELSCLGIREFVNAKTLWIR